MESHKRTLNRGPRQLQVDPNTLHKWFATTTERTLQAKADETIHDLLNFVDFLSNQCGLTFSLMQLTSNQVIKEIKELR